MMKQEAGRRVMYLHVKSRNTAKKRCPWAVIISCKPYKTGCMAFENKEDYNEWVLNGRRFEPVRGYKAVVSARYRGQMRYVECSDREKIHIFAPWAVKVIPVGEGFLAFELEDDFKKWWADKLP